MKRFLLTAAIILLAISTLATAKNPNYLSFIFEKPIKKNLTEISALPPNKPHQASLPEFVPYIFLFQHAVNVKNSNVGEKFKQDTRLSPPEYAKFERIAEDCQKEIRILDAKAKAIIDVSRQKYPGGKVPRGQAPPPPSPELFILQQQRNATILRYRNRLQNELEGLSFSRLDSFVKNEIRPKVKIN